VLLGGPFQFGRGGPGGWLIVDEPELHLGKDVLVPDLAGWRRQRMARLPETAAVELPPDWVCEVLSASTELVDRKRKLPIYARCGVEHVWLINPASRMLEARALVSGRWTEVGIWGGEDRACIAPFESVTLELRLRWGDASAVHESEPEPG
jgi:Uma2 family endonuclease